MPVFPVQTLPDSKGRFPLTESDRRHLKVLRLGPGSILEVSFPDRRRAKARILESPQGWSGQLIGTSQPLPDEVLPLWLGCGIVKPQRMDWLMEKCTELGLWRFSPLYLQYTRHQPSRPLSEQRLIRWRKLAAETLKQCERGVTPEIQTPQSLKEWLEQTESLSGEKYFLQARGEAPLLARLKPAAGLQHALLVGCEGGLSDPEVEAAIGAGFQAVSLGPGVFKTETATLIAAALLQQNMRNP